jgi:hypothetical protein
VLLGGVISLLIGIIYVKRRQHLRFQQKRRITIDSPTGSVVTIQEETLTPFTLPGLLSQLRTPRTKEPSAIIVPPAQRSTQARSNRGRDDSEGRDTLAETVQRLQERVAYLEGRSSAERHQDRRLRETRALSLSEDNVRSEVTSDPPPTYKS